MALFDDAEAFLRAMTAAPHAACRNAATAIGLSDHDPAQPKCVAHLHAIAIRYRTAAGVVAPNSEEMIRAVQGIADAAQQIDKHLETLLRGRITAPTNHPERAATLTGLHPSIVEILFPGLPPPDWDERQPLHAPFRNEFHRMAFRVASAAGRLGVNELAAKAMTTTRPTDPAFDNAIWQLARLYSDVTGERAFADHKGDDPGYRSPFAQLVETLWPALDPFNAAPGNERIRAALGRASAD